jgi:hypothetical protein
MQFGVGSAIREMTRESGARWLLGEPEQGAAERSCDGAALDDR